MPPLSRMPEQAGNTHCTEWCISLKKQHIVQTIQVLKEKYQLEG